MITTISHGRYITNASPDPVHKIEASECFNPDILHVFMDDEETANPASILNHSPCDRPPVPASTFPQFPHLPAELRYLIWEAAVPEPTVVPRTWSYGDFRYTLKRKVPAVLQACSEARRLLVGSPAVAPGVNCRSQVPKYRLVQRRGREDEGVYVDWRVDSIWIYRGYCIHADEIAAYAGLENLVMNWGLRPCWVDSAVGHGVGFVQQFPRLKLLTLLVDFSEHGWPEPSTLKGLKKLKRDEVKRIWALVQKAFREAQELDPRWSPPSLHIAHRTANWSRQEAR